ncbi:MAG TPA: FHA domain-containing protein, partial [Herpetosiphonaceae bacterium]
AAPSAPAAAPSAAPPASLSSLAGLILKTPSGDTLTLPAKSEVVIGREDAASNNFPDIDLTPQGALNDGVGRRHARLFLQGGQVHIEDLDSTNGTFVNKQKLAPRQPRPLQEGEEIRLGKLILSLSR